MQNESWIKLYRKTIFNGIMADHQAWVLFSWMLLRCNRKGEIIVSRYITAPALKIKVGSFWSVLQRLEKKWQVISTTPSTHETLVRIVNWGKYQNENDDPSNTISTNLAPNQHQPSTYTRIENKRIENNINIPVTNVTGKKAKASSCPLDSSKGTFDGLKTKYPKGHSECVEFLLAVEKEKGHKFVSPGVQFRYIHQILRSNHDFTDMNKTVDFLEGDKFWQSRGWDFTTIAKQLDKK